MKTKAYKAYCKARNKSRKAREARDKACKAYDEARYETRKAYKAYYLDGLRDVR